MNARRSLPVDALRGFDMFWIIGGQNVVAGLARLFPGRASNAVVDQLEHVPWQGLHFYDVIWPLFMFLVGVALSFSLARRREQGAGAKEIYLHALQRALILFALGMIAQGNLLQFDLSTFRPCYSVLHGIAAGYLIATIVVWSFQRRAQMIIAACFLILYWVLLVTIQVPGVGRGVLTADGNAAIYIDRLVLGGLQYGENTWFLSYPGFASSVLAGVFAGDLLRSRVDARVKCVRLFVYGAGLLAAGCLWSIWLPVIKLLWTSSFVLVGAGLSCLALAVFYLVIEVLGFRKWSFLFAVIGMNSLAVYMATMLFDFRKIGNIFVGHILPRIGAYSSVVESSAALLIVWLGLYWMYRNGSFLKL